MGSNHLNLRQALPCGIVNQVAVVLLDHGERSPRDLRDFKGAYAIEQRLRDEAVPQGVETGLPGSSARAAASFTSSSQSL